jgi:hypothetical protein
VFTYRGNTYAAYPFAVRLKNVTKAKEIMARIKEITEKEATGLQMSAWRTVLQKFPELSMYVSANGNYNMATVIERVTGQEAAYKKDHEGIADAPVFDRDAAIEEAKTWCAQRVQQMLVSTPELARIVTFTAGAYPTTIDALVAGVDLVREIVDRDKTPSQTLDLIDQPIDHDFWQEVDAAEVASFIDSFCGSYKQ